MVSKSTQVRFEIDSIFIYVYQAHFMRQEQMQVTIDLKLPSNEILHFTGESAMMTERDKIIGIV